MANRKGVMVYFDVRPAMRRLTAEEKGRLLDALLDYGEHGALPDFEDSPLLGMAWDFIRPKLDRDARAYDEKCQKNRYSAYCRIQQEAGVPKSDIPPFETWRGMQAFNSG